MGQSLGIRGLQTRGSYWVEIAHKVLLCNLKIVLTCAVLCRIWLDMIDALWCSTAAKIHLWVLESILASRFWYLIILHAYLVRVRNIDSKRLNTTMVLLVLGLETALSFMALRNVWVTGCTSSAQTIVKIFRTLVTTVVTCALEFVLNV